ncbi:MAG: type II toxin-antitoxin system VapC family toxin [Pseudomonadota bacterium]
MRVLIDTQALLWWLIDSDQLGEKARRIFLSEEPIISPVIIWEVAIKANLGKLDADVSKVCQAVAEAGFEKIGFADSHMIALSRLDHHHRDPFDRMLVAQSISEDVPVLTSDSKISLYGVEAMDSRA